MQEYRVIKIAHVKRSKSVMSLRMQKPAGFTFMPGQFIKVCFDQTNKNNKMINKYLSLSCSPHNEYLEVSKRVSESEFSQRFCALKDNEEVLIAGPMGNCVFNDTYKKIAFLSGGIGITPALSIIEYIAHNKLSTDVIVLYSNRFDDDIPFMNEINRWIAEFKNIQVRYLISDCEPENHMCIQGAITEELARRHISDIADRYVYLFGPPGMVRAMRDICIQMSCDEKKVKIENFIGY